MLDVQENGESVEKTFTGKIGADGVVKFEGKGTDSNGNIITSENSRHQVMVTNGAQALGGSYGGLFGGGNLSQSTKIHELGSNQFRRTSTIKTGAEGNSDARAQTDAMASDMAMVGAVPVAAVGIVAVGVTAAVARTAALKLIAAYRSGGMWAAMGETEAIATLQVVIVEGAGVASGTMLTPSVRTAQALAVAERVVVAGLKGRLSIDPTGIFSNSERTAAWYMASKGNVVNLRSPTNVGRTSDMLVNGVPYDVYSPTTGNAARIISAIAKKNDQAQGVVVDLSNSTVRAADLGNALQRMQNTGASNIKDIVIIGGD